MGYLILSVLFTGVFFLVKRLFVLSMPYVSITISLAFIILIGFFVGKFFQKMGFPEITGYLITGILLSPYSFGLLTEDTVRELDFIKEFAITFIALQSGMEMKWSFIKEYGKDVMLLTISIAIIAFSGLFFFSSFVLKSRTDMYIKGAILLGVLLILKSPLSTITVIKESKTRTLFGDKILGVAILKDVLVLAVFAILIPFLSGKSSSVFIVFVEIFGSALVGFVLSIFISLYMKHIKTEVPIFLFVVAFFISQMYMFHLDPLIISIIIGFSMQNVTSYGEDFQVILDKISPVIYLLFFSLADAGIDFYTIFSLTPVALLLILVKWIFTEFAILAVTKDKLMRKYGTFGLLNQSGLSLALVVLVENAFPGIGTIVKGIVIAVIVITDLFAPILFKRALVIANDIEKKQ